MVKYRRYYAPGGTYFFTVTLQDRKSNWLTKYVSQLRDALRRVNQLYPYKTIAMVILPDHFHAMWELPDGDTAYSLRLRLLKSEFGRNLKKAGIQVLKNRFGENILWQRRFWEHTIRDERDYRKHVNYIHYNPVKHNLVRRVSDWPYSTFHRYVKLGILPINWCYQDDDLNVE